MLDQQCRTVHAFVTIHNAFSVMEQHLQHAHPLSALHEIVPESALLAMMPAHLRHRFETALQLMHQSLAEPLSWETIAQRSAISPFHFHRQFTQLFHETPGQYLNRLRLQFAVSRLLTVQQASVTDIALSAGFSSSQSLAKALKRETGFQPKQVKTLGAQGTPGETIAFLAKLAHPSQRFPIGQAPQSLEQQLAASMPCELLWFPARGISRPVTHRGNWTHYHEHFGARTAKMLCATPITQLERSWQDMSASFGLWRMPPETGDDVIEAGHYLCSQVRIASEMAYLKAIESLFQIAEKLGYEINTSGCLLETLLEMDTDFAGYAIFNFQIPVQLPEAERG
ncbi:helix-turn-helix transcriptional regulator [Photobacterium sp. 1_MG-2023]|uniref:helix-turn-helix transcriptional regulator n=1 Tax=Photobacterium sp. 1_MG-2023 TaxID=3062646 RepID=UPI0026E42663|nr:AraC family transcriptional regulator [Photobacterium sp. 1_MG-2023]MDO6708391.1 AraC family transcriptional regulator [Photobacterium sp. 1_MG-2023]